MPVRAYLYVALCVLGRNQLHFLCGRLCSLIGVLANNRGKRRKSVFSFLLLVLQQGLGARRRLSVVWSSSVWRFTATSHHRQSKSIGHYTYNRTLEL